MLDIRAEKLAKNLVNYSVSLKKGEKLLIEALNHEAIPIAAKIADYAYKKGAVPFITLQDQSIDKAVLQNCNEEQLKIMAEADLVRMKHMNAYIRVLALANSSMLSSVSVEKIQMYNKYYLNPVHREQRINNTKWCVLKYPTNSTAQLANMSTEDFEDFYFKICNMDYKRMSNAMNNLVALMEKTDKVRIISKNTDLSFSIKDIPVVKCAGKRNIPDGEVYTAPVKDSVNGIISFNTPSMYQGSGPFENIYLEIKKGKIVKATANDTEKLNKILDTDEGSRYIGEFSFGLNPYITFPMKDVMFDEKIAGSFHLTPGRCYQLADNGNQSAVHWDMVQIQTPEYGGGEIWFDSKLIRKDGLFVIKELQCLNPENLK